MRSFDFNEMERLIDHYLEKYNPRKDNQMAFCLAQSDLLTAIVVAVKSIDVDNKTHFHQRRIDKAELEKFSQILISKIEDIKKIQSFEELFKIINSTKTSAISDLSVYDFSLRIGNFMKIYQDRIYLQSGTKTGAEVLLGNLGNKKVLFKTDLPQPFQTEKINLADIENILFEYQRELKFCVLWD